MSVLDQLEPQGVFRFFEALCGIPHGSGNTRAVSDWCVEFARTRGLEIHQDALNNVVLIQEASPGYEAAPPVILQGHLDMVCEQTPDCAKDMAQEGLDLAVEGDLIFAKGTTLGGDDGIAVAMALAVLDDDSLAHPRLEVVLTVDEEVGMPGAVGLDVSPLRGRRLLNIDSEEEGAFTVGCAGGSVTVGTLPVRRERWHGTPLRLTVGGLTGGHSGMEIHRGRANATQLLGRAFHRLGQGTELRLCTVSGGNKDNAIPREGTAALLAADATAVRTAAAELEAALRREYRVAEPELFLRVEDGDSALLPMDAPSTDRVVWLLQCAPSGVQEMSAELPGLVQTSLNLGILTCGEDALRAVWCVRSNLASQKTMLQDRLRCLLAALGGHAVVESEYPAWEYRPDSPLRALMTEVFRAQYGREPSVSATHGGLECGILAEKLPGLDCVSFGPDLTDIHTPRERMSISSVQRVWAFLLEVLARCQ